MLKNISQISCVVLEKICADHFAVNELTNVLYQNFRCSMLRNAVQQKIISTLTSSVMHLTAGDLTPKR